MSPDLECGMIPPAATEPSIISIMVKKRDDVDMTNSLDAIHHVAISVKNIAEAVDWYRTTFRCEIAYQDPTWAFLKFSNMHLALVLPEQHPPHLAVATPQAATYGELKTHRDGTRSVYISDVAGNAVELMDPESL